LPADAGTAGDASYTSGSLIDVDVDDAAVVPVAPPALLLPLVLLPPPEPVRPDPEWELEGTSESMTDRSFCRAASSMVGSLFASPFFHGHTPSEERNEHGARKKKNKKREESSLRPKHPLLDAHAYAATTASPPL
jgi:hypothetical protein